MCWFTAYSEWGGFKVLGVYKYAFFFFLFLNRILSKIPRSQNNTGAGNLRAELIAFFE